MDTAIYGKAVLDMIRWYRNLDFSQMREDARDEILDIYIDDGKPVLENTKIQISLTVTIISLAYNDIELLQLQKEIMDVTKKEDAKRVLNQLSEHLKSPKYHPENTTD